MLWDIIPTFANYPAEFIQNHFAIFDFAKNAFLVMVHIVMKQYPEIE
jgi:hypothetical protein